MADPLVDLVMVAATLKGASPAMFQSLVAAIKTIEAKTIVEMISADDPYDVIRSQGKVRAIQEIRKNVAEAAELRDIYQRREQHGRSTG